MACSLAPVTATANSNVIQPATITEALNALTLFVSIVHVYSCVVWAGIAQSV
jgi:hypothetical protein